MNKEPGQNSQYYKIGGLITEIITLCNPWNFQIIRASELKKKFKEFWKSGGYGLLKG